MYDDKEELKHYHFAREYRAGLVLSQEELMKNKRENLKNKFIILKRKVKDTKNGELAHDTINIINVVEDAINFFEKRYGENLKFLDRAKDSKIEEMNQLVNRLLCEINKCIDKKEKSSPENSNIEND